MGRKASHRISRPHPHKRFADTITLLNYRRGPTDDIWGATFLIDGKWRPKDGVSLGTRDFDEAAEIARDKFTLLVNGQPVARYRASTPRTPEHALQVYAKRAIDKMLDLAEEADRKVLGKGHNYRTQAGRIGDLLLRWGQTSIEAMNEHDLNAWVEHEFRVEDREATVAKYGRQPRGDGRQIVFKKPAATSLGNLDWAMSLVWSEAVADRVVERRDRPIINKSLGEDSDPRAFIDDAGVRACMSVMTDDWVNAPNGHGPEMKRLLRCYIALIATAGIRPGLEAKRVRLGDITFTRQHGVPVIFVRVQKNQGKHHRPRSVVVFEGNPAIRIRHVLSDLKARRESQGARKTDYLFAWVGNMWPTFRDTLNDVLREAGALTDPMTGEKRVAYSFRHYFATVQIERGISVAHLAEWMGTSSAMIEKHYNRFLVEWRAHLVNGAPDEPMDYIDEEGVPWHWDAEIGESGEWVPG